jgi:glutamine amidotransferase
MGRTIQMVERAMDDHHLAEPFLLTAAVSDGHTIYAVRYARYAEAPTLYYGCGVQLDDISAIPRANSGNAIFILSEPLDFERENWISVPPGHMVVAGDGAVAVTRFQPADAAPPVAKIVPLFNN